jgi:hypothetical protein
MDQRMQFIADDQRDLPSVVDLAERFDICRKTPEPLSDTIKSLSGYPCSASACAR